MKLLLFTILTSLVLLLTPSLAHAQTPPVTGTPWVDGVASEYQNYDKYSTKTVTPGMAMSLASNIVSPVKYDANGQPVALINNSFAPNINRVIGLLYENQPSSQEYVADILNNIGVPTVSRAYAQADNGGGTGYSALSPLLPLWKVFRNLAYSLYIIMFVIVGIMIMLRTKVNAQTIITIQSALPNLLITLILITFSYAIVGFMIDLMYFLIYFVVYLVAAADLIDAPKFITRIMSGTAYNVIFEGRDVITASVAKALEDVAVGIGGVGAKVVIELTSFVPGLQGGFFGVSPVLYLVVAVMFAWQMLKLAFILIKSYVMLLIQVITAPVQILMNAIPGSKAFGEWLKKTASYLIPYPIVAAMLLFAAILIGPTQKAYLYDSLKTGDTNPLGINAGADLYTHKEDIWVPPFTLPNTQVANLDVFTIIAFCIVLMTPAAAKMAQDWLQVKESPYTAEIGAAFGAVQAGYGWGAGIGKGIKSQAEQRELMRSQANWIGDSVRRGQTATPPGASSKD